METSTTHGLQRAVDEFWPALCACNRAPMSPVKPMYRRDGSVELRRMYTNRADSIDTSASRANVTPRSKPKSPRKSISVPAGWQELTAGRREALAVDSWQSPSSAAFAATEGILRTSSRDVACHPQPRAKRAVWRRMAGSLGRFSEPVTHQQVGLPTHALATRSGEHYRGICESAGEARRRTERAACLRTVPTGPTARCTCPSSPAMCADYPE